MKRLLLVVATTVVMAVGLASPAAAAPGGPSGEACFVHYVRGFGVNIGEVTSAFATSMPPGAVGTAISGRAQERGSETPYSFACPGRP